ncbi:MAG: hypothetical protein GY953_39765, partial [bacterium]|nr:hypothetical protein [bacterium]
MAPIVRFAFLVSLAAWTALAAPIVVSPDATELERYAAGELAEGLRWLYPKSEFVVQDTPAVGDVIVMETAPAYQGGFNVGTRESDGRTVGVISGASPPAVLSAVYALLEELGFGYYISYTAFPPRREEEFAFQGWELRDQPLFGERLVFNWHNFLSSASTWEFEDWQHYIDQAARMRFSGIMVHAYGNNPMFQFTHNGETKPVGYLSTTASGRDWGTQHVNDVRSLYGGAHVFDQPVFGSSAAMVPDERRARAARELMQRVFAYAESRGMDVNFALDVDTLSANPQNVIRTLPAHARFTSGGVELANPDTPEGSAYWRGQVEKLLSDYPQIDVVTVWHRRNRTPWRTVKVLDFPAPWQAEFTGSAMADDPHGPSMFAIGKIVHAFRRALPKQVKLATGTWGFTHMPAADAYFPRDVTFMPLDYQIKFESEAVQSAIKAVSARRRMVPIVWAHHDDFSYVGRPYTPFINFASLLESGNNKGYAIIHWTTRPLDLYFKSLSEQVWERTRDQPVETTCRRMAERTFGTREANLGTMFLMEWVQNTPMFGRETTDRFVDRPIGDFGPNSRHTLLRQMGGLALP